MRDVHGSFDNKTETNRQLLRLKVETSCVNNKKWISEILLFLRFFYIFAVEIGTTDDCPEHYKWWKNKK